MSILYFSCDTDKQIHFQFRFWVNLFTLSLGYMNRYVGYIYKFLVYSDYYFWIAYASILYEISLTQFFI